MTKQGFFSKLFKFFTDPFYSLDEDSGLAIDGREHLLYREGDKILRIGVETLAGNPSLVIYPQSMKQWESPHQDTVLTNADKERILRKICNHFDLKKVHWMLS